MSLQVVTANDEMAVPLSRRKKLVKVKSVFKRVFGCIPDATAKVREALNNAHLRDMRVMDEITSDLFVDKLAGSNLAYRGTVKALPVDSRLTACSVGAGLVIPDAPQVAAKVFDPAPIYSTPKTLQPADIPQKPCKAVDPVCQFTKESEPEPAQKQPLKDQCDNGLTANHKQIPKDEADKQQTDYEHSTDSEDIEGEAIADDIESNELATTVTTAASSASMGSYEPDSAKHEEAHQTGYSYWLERRQQWTQGGPSKRQKKSILSNIPESYYPTIYNKLVRDGSQLKQPMALSDALEVIRAGWATSGQYPDQNFWYLNGA